MPQAQVRCASPEDARRVLAEGFQSFPHFCGLLDIIPKNGRRQKFRLNQIQRIYCANRTARDVILKPRQVGFTTVEQARDAFVFLTVPGARVTMMVQSISDPDSPARKARRVFDLFFESLRAYGLRLNFGKAPAGVWTLPERDSVLRIVEAGASKAAAEKKGRGDTVTRLHVTEQAFWEYAEESLLAIESSVIAPELGGEIVKESTPNGAGGKFYNDVQNAQAGYSRYKLHFYPWYLEPSYRSPLADGEIIVPATEREQQLVKLGVTPEQLKWFRNTVADKGGQAKVDQEFATDPDSCFLLSGRPFFATAALEAMKTASLGRGPRRLDEIRELAAYGQLRIWEEPKKGNRYVLILDPSEGTGGDRAAGIVLERGTGRHMATLHGQFREYQLAKWGVKLARIFFDATIAVERNNHGGAVLQALEREQRYPWIWHDADRKPGWLTGETSRAEALSMFEDAIRKGEWVSWDAEVQGELRSFVINKRGKPEASSGSYDDLVMASAIGLDVIRKPEPPRGLGDALQLGLIG